MAVESMSAANPESDSDSVPDTGPAGADLKSKRGLLVLGFALV